LVGVNKLVNKDSNANNVVFYLPEIILFKPYKIVLSGFANGYWKDRFIRHFKGIVVCQKVPFKKPFIISSAVLL
jgi:hypothetical protein